MFPYLIAGAIGFAVAKLFEEDEAPKYADGGSVLLAPNGKPSNLTPEQYKLVRTPAFKQWFGYWDLIISGKSKSYQDNGIREICHLLKKGDFPTIKIVAKFLSKQVSENDILIPMPSRKGCVTDNHSLLLSNEISKISGARVYSDLCGSERESLYDIKKQNIKLKDIDLGLFLKSELPNGAKYFIVDNVIGTGFSMYNAQLTVGKNAEPLVYAIDDTKISKVVDENGEPLVVYHGTQKKFNVFDKKEIGSNYGYDTFGFYFTEDGGQASSYAYLRSNINTNIVLEVFLSIKNPLTLNEIKSQIPNIEDKYLIDEGEYEDISEIKIYDSNRKVIDKLAKNKDGIIIRYDYGFYAVRDSNQIKLADGTNTTFDGNNPDIRFDGGGSVNVIDIEQYNIGGINYRFVEIAEKNHNKIELYRQAGDGKYYGNILYRRVPRYTPKFSSPMVNDLNQLYAFEPVSNSELFNAVKNKTKPFASLNYWVNHYDEGEIENEIESYISVCKENNLQYSLKRIKRDNNPNLDSVRFEVCQSGTFEELFDMDALIEDYWNNDIDSFYIEKLDEIRDLDLSYFLHNEWDDGLSDTGLILGIPPKFTMSLIIMGISYGLAKKYNYNQEVKIIENTNSEDVQYDGGGEITTYTEFYNKLKIEDGSKYIGKKFTDVFPYLKRSGSLPHKYRLIVKKYNNALKRLSENNYSTKSMKQADVNKIERMKLNMNKKKYLAKFYCDNAGTIIDFKK
jgi:hypothetical protein